MENLKFLRNNAGLSQAELAAKLKMPQTTYSHYESGRSEPSIENILKIADYFGCSIDYLLGHETKNILHLDSWTAKEKVAINLMKQLDDDQLTLLLGYLAKMTDTPLEEVQNKLGEV